MRAILGSIFSYLFMSSSFSAVVCLFAIVLIVVRKFFGTVSPTENDYLIIFIRIFIVSVILSPVSHYFSIKYGKGYTQVDIDF